VAKNPADSPCVTVRHLPIMSHLINRTTTANRSPRPVIFTLSNRQLKTLNESRQPLVIFIPCPPDPPEDLIRWASTCLPSVSGMVVSARLETAICKRPDNQTNGLQTAFGYLLSDWDDDAYCYCISVVSVMLRPQRVRGSIVGPQWPGGPIEQPMPSEQPLSDPLND
jgi:hypothetical protein